MWKFSQLSAKKFKEIRYTMTDNNDRDGRTVGGLEIAIQAYPCYCKIAPSQLGRGVVVYSTTHNIFSGLRYLEDHY
ncbi:unnamed protein product [Rhizophagus irregularis]|uniref:Uncharacterized protein n=1 Tax=Rhizophagus irregularis TaxID=588596 RepID=A0A915Z8M8_9GLOM|nr:unnamed protein product [Rhizophagus irregularis]CAB5190893.1 unnamed protein product [Rhizophagus irregularis]CAB5211593.1 unnamed protein product [Rhizophagus irregularis]CAB5367156.1 unnamed protein product [Rhizophagus irregularis]CAB5382995.1 unnamed protein product [Rhizophagus irregularis]